MKVILIGLEGTDLYTTLYDSDTSRAMLRFYHPVRHPAGVEITTASLGSALSLVSELRWYLQRYVDEVLFTEDGSVYLTHDLASGVYERGVTLTRPWPHRFRYRIHGGKIYRSAWDLAAFGDSPAPVAPPGEGMTGGTGTPDPVLEVWGLSDEIHESPSEVQAGPEQPGEEPGTGPEEPGG
jgi:hypothetical protein